MGDPSLDLSELPIIKLLNSKGQTISKSVINWWSKGPLVGYDLEISITESYLESENGNKFLLSNGRCTLTERIIPSDEPFPTPSNSTLERLLRFPVVRLSNYRCRKVGK